MVKLMTRGSLTLVWKLLVWFGVAFSLHIGPILLFDNTRIIASRARCDIAAGLNNHNCDIPIMS